MSELFFSLAKSLICLVGTFNKKQINRQPRAGKGGYYLLFYYYRICVILSDKTVRKKDRGRRDVRTQEKRKLSSCSLACSLHLPTRYLFIYVHKRYIPIWNQPQQFSLYSTILHSLHNSTLTKRHLFYTYNIHL